jgi:hypothetical protein
MVGPVHAFPPGFLDKWRQNKAFSASSCRKTLENRLSILLAQRTKGGGAQKGYWPRLRVSTASALVRGKSSMFFPSFLKGWTQWQLR